MSEFVRRHGLLLTALLLLGVSCQLMSASIKNAALPRLGGRLINSVLAPVQEVFHEVSFSLGQVWNRYVALQNVESERDKLLERVKNLEAENSRLIEFESQNDRLRKLLDYKESTGAEGIAAGVSSSRVLRSTSGWAQDAIESRVIGREPTNFAHTITIDRGANQGVKTGMPVLNGNAVVGQIIAASGASSKVLLLTDNMSAIDAIVQRSRSQGVVEGMLERRLRLRYVLREHDVRVGDRVIASGLDGIFPKGAFIGVVTLADKGASGLFQNIELQPSVDLDRLENVLVLTKQGDRQPALGQEAASVENPQTELQENR